MSRFAAWLAVSLIMSSTMAQGPAPYSIASKLLNLARVWRVAPYGGDSDYNGDSVVDEQDLLILIEGELPTPVTHTVLLPGSVPLEFILVQPGTFVMGADDPPYSATSETPPHIVTINHPFYLARYELTQKQWLAVMNTWPQFPPTVNTGLGDNKPAYYISWDDCHNLINTLNGMGLGHFRMPSEAEWEYACRAGSTTRYYYGDDFLLLGAYAWNLGNNIPTGTKDVGQKLPNAWGFYDMLGNADEYVEDDWHDSYRQTGSRPDDGSAWADMPRSASTVVRGGFFAQTFFQCRSSYRRGIVKATSRGEIHNLRLALDVPPTPTPTPTPPPGQETFTLTLPGNVPVEFIKVKSGSFVMGLDSPSLGPAHTVVIENSFYLAKYELTQKQWLAVMGSWPGTIAAYQPKPFLGLGDSYPAYYINWDDCHSFVNAVNQLGQGTYRLPSEAEWEYACGAGTTTVYYFGDDSARLKDYAWYSGNNNVPPDPYGTKPVGGKPANPWGFYDIIGNVLEWCEDDYHDDYGIPEIIAPIDGSAWIDSPRGPKAMMKGGSYLSAVSGCWTRYRENLVKSGDAGRGAIGVRIARDE